MDYHRCSFLWPGASMLDLSSAVPALAATLREHKEYEVARQAVCDAVLLHDRMLLEAMGILPARDLSGSANATVLVSAYVNDQRSFEQAEERLLATPTPQGMACTLQLLSPEASAACLAVLPPMSLIDTDTRQATTTPLSLVLGDGLPLPKIGNELSEHDLVRLLAGLPGLDQRMARLAQWWEEGGPTDTPFPPGLQQLLPPVSDIAPLRLKVPELMARLEAYAREVYTLPASGMRPSFRL